MPTPVSPIDHFVIASADPDVLEPQFLRLGFALRPRSALTGAGLGLCNRGIFLAGSRYIELLSVVDPGTEAYGVPAILAIRSGLIRLAICTTDLAGLRARAMALDHQVTAPVRHGVRFIHDGKPFEAACEVAHAGRPDTPTLGCYLVDYLQQYDASPLRAQPHPNGVVDASVAVVVGDPDTVQPFLALMRIGPGSEDTIEAMDRSEWEAMTGLEAEASHRLPYLAGVVFQVKDLTQTQAWMAEQGIDTRACGRRLMVHPRDAGNTALFFEQQR